MKLKALPLCHPSLLRGLSCTQQRVLSLLPTRFPPKVRGLWHQQRVELGILAWLHRSQLVCTWAHLAWRREGRHDTTSTTMANITYGDSQWVMPFYENLLLGGTWDFLLFNRIWQKSDGLSLLWLVYFTWQMPFPWLCFIIKDCLWRLERDILPLALRKRAVGTGSSTWQEAVGGLGCCKQAVGNGQQ